MNHKTTQAPASHVTRSYPRPIAPTIGELAEKAHITRGEATRALVAVYQQQAEGRVELYSAAGSHGRRWNVFDNVKNERVLLEDWARSFLNLQPQ